MFAGSEYGGQPSAAAKADGISSAAKNDASIIGLGRFDVERLAAVGFLFRDVCVQGGIHGGDLIDEESEAAVRGGDSGAVCAAYLPTRTT